MLNRVVHRDPLTLDRTLAAVADPKRREILDRSATGPVSISTLADLLEMSLPGVLKHVRVLEEADLLITHKVGRARFCELSPRPLDEVAGWVEDRRRRWCQLLDRFAEHVAERGEGGRE